MFNCWAPCDCFFNIQPLLLIFSPNKKEERKMVRSKKFKDTAQKKILAKEALILYIKAKRPLWDLADQDYKNLFLKAKLYEDVFNLMKEEFDSDTLSELSLESPDGVKSMWKNLRSTYNVNKKKGKGKSGAGYDEIPKPWVWQKQMSFLDETEPHLNSLRTSSLLLGPSSEVKLFIFHK